MPVDKVFRGLVEFMFDKDKSGFRAVREESIQYYVDGHNILVHQYILVSIIKTCTC